MALVLNEEQVMLKDAAAGFLAEKAGVPQLRALRDSGGEAGFDPAVWQDMVDMGWAGIAIPEAHGGLGCVDVPRGGRARQCRRHDRNEALLRPRNAA